MLQLNSFCRFATDRSEFLKTQENFPEEMRKALTAIGAFGTYNLRLDAWTKKVCRPEINPIQVSSSGLNGPHIITIIVAPESEVEGLVYMLLCPENSSIEDTVVKLQEYFTR